MDQEIIYDVRNYRNFKDESHLKNFLNYLMRTDITQKWTCHLTRGNIYFLRNNVGELEYFCNVTDIGRRTQLKMMVLSYLKNNYISLKSLRNDITYITPPFPKDECLDRFVTLTSVTMPEIWNKDCPFRGQSGKFLDNSICFVLHTDQSYDGDTLQFHVHRLFRI